MDESKVGASVNPEVPKEQGRLSTWSVIVRAQGEGSTAHAALGELIKRYESAVIAMVRAFGYPWNLSPEDLKQEFFLGLIRRGDIGKLDRTRGRFRDWLRAAVDNFMRNEWDAWHAEKRGNRLTALRPCEVLHGLTPELVFMRQFAETTLLHALERHREQVDDKERFDRFVRVLPAPQLDLAELSELASALGMPRNRAAVYVHRLRERHRSVLREVVADTLNIDPSDPQAEAALTTEMGLLYRLLCEVPRTQPVLEDA